MAVHHSPGPASSTVAARRAAVTAAVVVLLRRLTVGAPLESNRIWLS